MTSSLVAALAVTLATLAMGSPSSSLPSTPPPAPADPAAGDCIRSTSEARYRNAGYDHLVFITNACAAEAQCKVTTDVNPTPTEVAVPGKGTVEVLTWRGSPAREFKPTVTCKF